MAKRILIIEDDEEMAELLMMRLTSAGYTVRAVSDAYMAIKTAHEFQSDAIILDLMLPAGGGLSVLDRLRSSVHTKHTPVIVLTGMHDHDYECKARAKGVKAYLQKPCDAQVLIAELKRLSSESAGERDEGGMSSIGGRSMDGEQRGKRILVVEDEEDMAKLLRERLESVGYAVHTETSGKVGLTYVVEHQPDLVILDLMLPEVNGWNVCHQLKTDPRTTHIPVIVLSALLEEKGATKGPLDEGDFFMGKPFNAGHLLGKIQELLSRGGDST